MTDSNLSCTASDMHWTNTVRQKLQFRNKIGSCIDTINKIWFTWFELLDANKVKNRLRIQEIDS